MNIKYLLKRSINNRNGYLLGIVIMCVVLLVGYFSFALFTTESEKKGALNIEVGNLYSLIESKDFDNQKQITVTPGEKKMFKIKLTNVNQLEAKFNLFYSSESDLANVKIGYLQTGDIPPEEQGYTIKKYESGEDTKTIEVMIYNTSASAVTIKFDSHVGLKDKDLIFPIGMNVLKEYPLPTLRTRADMYQVELYSFYITKVIFQEGLTIPDDAVQSWDLSEDQDGSIAGYIVDDGFGNNTYRLYIQSETNQIYANQDCTYLFARFAVLAEIENLSYLNTKNVTDMSDMFSECNRLSSLDLSSFDTSNVTSMSFMFYWCGSLTSLDLSSFDTSKVTNMLGMFAECRNSATLNLSNFDTSRVTNMSYMFLNCNKLTILDVSNFNTTQVTDMSQMFYWCTKLTTLNLSSFDTSKVTNMSSMFNECESLTTLNLNNFNTPKVTDMSFMFSGCKNLNSLSLSNFNTAQVTIMTSMFAECINLTALNLNSFNTSKVRDMADMFYNCTKLTTLNLANFNTSEVRNMSSMFQSCAGLTKLDLSSFDTSKVTTMTYMFYATSAMTEIKVSSSKWVMAPEANAMLTSSGVSSLTYV